MAFNVLKYIGDAAKRVLTTKDLTDLGADETQLKSLSGNSVLTFVKGAAHDVEEDLAKFIAGHPKLSAEFHLLSDDEAEDEQDITNPVSEGAGSGDANPAGTTPTDPAATQTVTPVAQNSPAQTSTTESAVSTEPSPSTSEVAGDK